MTEYKENTVGWHLSRLKEPLRSRALTNTLEEKALAAPIAGMWEAIHLAFPWSDTPEGQGFWAGVHNFFQGQGRKPNRRAGVAEGWDMAKECAPDPEMVNPPLDLVSTGLGVMDTGNHPRLENFLKGMGIDTPIPPIAPGGYVDAPDHPLTNEQQSFQVEVVKIPPIEEWGEKIPIGSFDGFLPGIPVVHGYTPPRPVETIEGRHDRELKEQDVRIAALEDQIYTMQETIKWLTQNLQEHTHSDYEGKAQMSV